MSFVRWPDSAERHHVLLRDGTRWSVLDLGDGSVQPLPLSVEADTVVPVRMEASKAPYLAALRSQGPTRRLLLHDPEGRLVYDEVLASGSAAGPLSTPDGPESPLVSECADSACGRLWEYRLLR